MAFWWIAWTVREERVLATLDAGTVVVRAEKDPSKRVVITGMGVASCFGNDVDVFYDKYDYLQMPCTPLLTQHKVGAVKSSKIRSS